MAAPHRPIELLPRRYARTAARMPVDSAFAYGKTFALLGVFMKKLGIVLAALAVIVIAAAPAAQANSKKLWEGFVEELQKARTGAMAKK